MKVNKTLLFLVGMFWGVGSLGATALEDQIWSDSAKIGVWLNDEVGPAMIFNAAASPQPSADVHKPLGFELGVVAAGSSSKLDLKTFRGLPLNQLKTSELDLPSSLIVGLPLAYLKVGLPFDFDLGAKYGYVSYSDFRGVRTFDFKYSVWGGELRRRLLGEGVMGVVLPDVDVSVGYDYAQGHLGAGDHYDALLNGGERLNADVGFLSEWNTSAVTGRVVASKKLAFLTPSVGIGYSHLMGQSETTFTVRGSAASGPVHTGGGGSAQIQEGVPHVLGSLQISFLPFVKLQVGGLYAKDRWAATVGLRVN